MKGGNAVNQSVILYSTGCPKCAVLTKKLDMAGIAYDVITNVDEMTALGIKSAPMLRAGDELMDFAAANAWLRGQAVQKE